MMIIVMMMKLIMIFSISIINNNTLSMIKPVSYQLPASLASGWTKH